MTQPPLVKKTQNCKAKNGFFSLRDCGEPANNACTDCKRAMCSKHLSPASGFSRCLDCEARKPSTDQAAQAAEDLAYDDPAWPYRYRRRYYRDYSPWYFGVYYDSYYDDYDYRSFDRGMRRDASYASTADKDDTGFGDS
jgi:hypothetical protein